MHKTSKQTHVLSDTVQLKHLMLIKNVQQYTSTKISKIFLSDNLEKGRSWIWKMEDNDLPSTHIYIYIYIYIYKTHLSHAGHFVTLNFSMQVKFLSLFFSVFWSSLPGMCSMDLRRLWNDLWPSEVTTLWLLAVDYIPSELSGVCVCVCVCERERERERVSVTVIQPKFRKWWDVFKCE